MTPEQERHNRLTELFDRACALPEADRAAFLDQACGDDSDLRTELERMLAADAELPATDASPQVPSIATPEMKDPNLGRRVGPYELKQCLGEGGFGNVYLAVRRDDAKQYVALKLLKRGKDTREVLKRFAQEQRLLAGLQHDHIAGFLNAGETDDGLPYYVMEYVDGRPIDKYCDEQKLGTHDRLKLFQQVCSAVQFAHAKFVLHRDLKPSNILVTKEGSVKLVDFGIAKVMNPDVWGTLITIGDERPMTLEYASPEQARGEDLDARSDLYSLGVVLYELLTGHRPFQLATRVPEEIRRIICEETPTKPSQMVQHAVKLTYVDPKTGTPTTRTVGPEDVARTRDGSERLLKRRLSGDVDNILLYALRKEADRRYKSAQQISDDIGNLLKNEPLQVARPESRIYVLRKTIRRYWVPLTATAAVVLALIGGVAVATDQYLKAEAARQEALDQTAIANENLLIAQEREREAVDARLAETVQRELAEANAEQAVAVQRFLQTILESASPDSEIGQDATVKELLDVAGPRAREELQDQPEVLASLLQTIGRAYSSLGSADQATVYLEQSARTWRQVLETAAEIRTDELRLHLAASLMDRVLVTTELGGSSLDPDDDRQRALTCCREALSIRESILGGDAELTEKCRLVEADLLRLIDQPEFSEWMWTIGARFVAQQYDACKYAEPHATMIRTIKAHWTERDYQSAADCFSEYCHSTVNELQQLAVSDPDAAYALIRQHTTPMLESETWRWYVSDALGTIAQLVAADGRVDAAKIIISEAMSVAREVHGDEHPKTAIQLTLMGRLLRIKGEYEEAESACEQALEMFLRTVSEEHPRIAYTLHELAKTRDAKGDAVGAEQAYRKQVAIWRKAPTQNSYSAIVAMNRLAVRYKCEGRYDDAEPLFIEAMDISRQVLGTEHADTLTITSNLASLYEDQGRYQEAEPLYAEVHETRQSVHGAKHPKTRESKKALRRLRGRSGRRVRPESRNRPEGVSPIPRRSKRRNVVWRTGMSLFSQGELAEAEPHLRAMLEADRSAKGDEHPITLSSMGRLGHLLLKRGRLTEAESLCREAVQSGRRVLGNDDPITLRSIGNLALVLQSQGSWPSAESLIAELLDAAQSAEPSGEWVLAAVMAEVGANLNRSGRFWDAEPLLRESVRIWECRLGADEWPMFSATGELGRSLAGQGRFADAEALLLRTEHGVSRYTELRSPAVRDPDAKFVIFPRESGTWMRVSKSVVHELHSSSLQSIIDLYSSWHAAEPGAGHNAKAAEWKTKLRSYRATTQPTDRIDVSATTDLPILQPGDAPLTNSR